MNFDFSDELKQLRDEARKFLGRQGVKTMVRHALEGEPYDAGLWQAMAGLGWTGATIPESHGGSGLGHLAVCVLAEEIGYAAAPVPFSSSVYLATEAILTFGSQSQQERWLPRLASGDAVGTFALAEGAGPFTLERVRARVEDRGLSGVKMPVPDGEHAHFAIVVARDDKENLMHLVDLATPQVRRTQVPTLDRSRPQARFDFDRAPAEPLQGATRWNSIRLLLDRAAIMMAFEQIGGAQAALEMARDYALERYAFGRPIASFQAIKHKLADVYMAIELARSSAYYGAWALDKNAPELAVAASAARIAAIDAAWVASKENIQTHGGMGYTWELDCHLYYRRAKFQALTLGSAREWKRRLLDEISPKSVPYASPEVR